MKTLTLILLPSLLSASCIFSHWPFDIDLLDLGPGARHATLVLSNEGSGSLLSTEDTAPFGSAAFRFGDGRDYLSFPAITFSASDAYTLAFWARKSPGDTGRAAQWDFVLGDRDSDFNFVALPDTNGSGVLRWRGASSDSIHTADFPVPVDHDWHHYALVVQTGSLRLYVDGELSGTVANRQTGFTFNTIGEGFPARIKTDFHGWIDEFYVFNCALDATDVKAIFSNNRLDPTSLPEGIHFSFDGDFLDSSTIANHLAPIGTVALSNDPLGTVAGTAAVQLDNSANSRLSLATPLSFTPSDPWTVTWWARRSQLGASRGMVLGRAGTLGDFIWLNDSQRGLRFRNSPATSFDFYAPKDSGLHAYALVADGIGNLDLYIDGNLSESMTGDTSFYIETVGEGFPTSSANYNFQGWIDELRIFSQSLSASRIRNLYETESPFMPPPSPQSLLVYLLGGQSNAVGHGSASQLPPQLFYPQEDIDFFYHFKDGPFVHATVRPGVSRNGSFGPEISFARRLSEIHGPDPKTRIAIIKYAHGGTNLHTQWRGDGTASNSNDGPEYLAFQETVSRGLASLREKYPIAEISIAGMAWMQGESDRDPRFNPDYEDNLNRFIADIRATIDPIFLLSSVDSRIARLPSPCPNSSPSNPLRTVLPPATPAQQF